MFMEFFFVFFFNGFLVNGFWCKDTEVRESNMKNYGNLNG